MAIVKIQEFKIKIENILSKHLHDNYKNFDIALFRRNDADPHPAPHPATHHAPNTLAGVPHAAKHVPEQAPS